MDIKEFSVLDVVKSVKSSQNYKKWLEKNKKAYLISLLVNVGEEQNEILVNYYNPDTDRSATFNYNKEFELQEDELFKNGEEKVNELKLREINLPLDKAVGIAEHEADKKDGARINKKIAILQEIDGEIVWNLTLVSSDFKTINVRVGTNEGKVLKYVSNSLTDLMKGAF